MLDLHIPVTPTTVASIKQDLTTRLPEVKSSHRCEAFARGLGFRAYASLRAATSLPEPVAATVDAVAFGDYLALKGIEMDGGALYRAVARAAVDEVLSDQSCLSARGYGMGAFQRMPEGRWQTVAEQHADYFRDRATLAEDSNLDAFLLALALVERIPKTKTTRGAAGSYRLKHIAENYRTAYPCGAPLGPAYVAKGVLIIAALHAGFRMKTYVLDDGGDDPNVTFNMSKRAIDNLDCEIRPDGAEAQARKWRAKRRDPWPMVA